MKHRMVVIGVDKWGEPIIDHDPNLDEDDSKQNSEPLDYAEPNPEDR